MALVSGTESALPPLNPLPHNVPVVMAEVDAYASSSPDGRSNRLTLFSAHPATSRSCDR